MEIWQYIEPQLEQPYAEDYAIKELSYNLQQLREEIESKSNNTNTLKEYYWLQFLYAHEHNIVFI